EESTLELSELILNTPTHKRGLVWLPTPMRGTSHAYAWPEVTPSTHGVTTHAYAWLGVTPSTHMRGTFVK
ncbi:hypothetical protein PIB30_111926, partial [Stylosanthes scabra]|nr:hypothetical protein [Stylosanthes scabra]